MLVAPNDNVIVKVKTKYISNISSLLKRSAIQNGSTVDPLDFVNICGEVVSVPLSISKRFDYEGYSARNIYEGDIAIFSSAVIGDTKVTEDDKVLFKNRIWHDGEEYFAVNIMKLFGVIRGGDIYMVNGFVMLSMFEEKKIILPAHMKKAKGVMNAKVLHIGYAKTNKKQIDVNEGDTVLFNPNKATKYQINNKPFIILSQDHILAKEV